MLQLNLFYIIFLLYNIMWFTATLYLHDAEHLIKNLIVGVTYLNNVAIDPYLIILIVFDIVYLRVIFY